MSDPLKVKYESAIYCGLVAAPQFGFRYRCEQIGIEHIPLLASPQGVAERVTRYREASADREAGVVFRSKTKRKTTPAAAASVASQYLIDDAATPPCGDARWGMALDCNSFTASTSAHDVFFVQSPVRRGIA